MEDYFYYDDVDGTAPCEFCGEPFPFDELILHQTSHFAEEDVYEYPLFDDHVDVKQLENPVSQVEKSVAAAKVNTEKREIQNNVISDIKKEPKIAFEAKQTLGSDIKIEPKLVVEKKSPTPMKNNKSEVKTFQDEKEKEFLKKTGKKLLTYGTDVDPVQDLDQEKEVYKMPSHPILNTKYKEKDEEDINNLSDDDSSETLEEFWIRAREFLKRNRVTNKC